MTTKRDLYECSLAACESHEMWGDFHVLVFRYRSGGRTVWTATAYMGVTVAYANRGFATKDEAIAALRQSMIDTPFPDARENSPRHVTGEDIRDALRKLGRLLHNGDLTDRDVVKGAQEGLAVLLVHHTAPAAEAPMCPGCKLGRYVTHGAAEDRETVEKLRENRDAIVDALRSGDPIVAEVKGAVERLKRTIEVKHAPPRRQAAEHIRDIIKRGTPRCPRCLITACPACELEESDELVE